MIKFFNKKKLKTISVLLPRTRSFDPSESSVARRIILFSAIIVGVAFFILIVRLWYLQLLQGEYYRSLSESNRIRILDIPPSRGLIFDVKGRLLVDNCSGFSLVIIPDAVEDWTELGNRLAQLLGIAPEEVNRVRDIVAGGGGLKPVRLRNNLDYSQLALLETFRYELPGVKVQIEHRRSYLYPIETAHIIGYLGEINQGELAVASKRLYRIGDYVGRYGLEKSYERILHGQRGVRHVEVDVLGREIKLLDEIDAVQGRNINLTIDLELQQAAQIALGDQVGSVVALDPKTGEIYCLYSSPSFNQNNFITGMSSRFWEAIINDFFHPLKNRAISGLYPPGSTYKIITAIAGLAEGVIVPSTNIYCSGEIFFGHRNYKCWAFKKGGHGSVDLHRAIKESCDVYFYHVGMRLGVERLAKYGRAFGLGRPTGIPLNSESSGLVPDIEWKKRKIGESWQEGETLSLAIGQGFNLTTPIQLACIAAIIANKGRFVTPSLVKNEQSDDIGNFIDNPLSVIDRLPIKVKDIENIHQGLIGVVNEAGGTANIARLPGITVAGKTGTSQIVSLHIEKNYGSEVHLPWKYKNHALFICYAPAEDPVIAMAVVVEHGGHGGSEAAPIARKILETFFGVLPHPDKPKDSFGPLFDYSNSSVLTALIEASSSIKLRKNDNKYLRYNYR